MRNHLDIIFQDINVVVLYCKQIDGKLIWNCLDSDDKVSQNLARFIVVELIKKIYMCIVMLLFSFHSKVVLISYSHWMVVICILCLIINKFVWCSKLDISCLNHRLHYHSCIYIRSWLNNVVTFWEMVLYFNLRYLIEKYSDLSHL